VSLADDPCRLVRQVKKIEWLERVLHPFCLDPCRLVRQVNEIFQL